MAQLSDAELDRDWKPNGRRPQSTIAQSFSQELGDIFKIESSITDLNDKVDRRQKSVLYRTNELEELEARIREAEERLRRSQLPSTFAGPAPSRGPPPRSSARQHAASIFSSRAEEKPQPAQSPQQKPEQQQQQRRDRATSNSATSSKHGSRPGTARAGKNVPGGAMPPTPTASEGQRGVQHSATADATAAATPDGIARVEAEFGAPSSASYISVRSFASTGASVADYVLVSKDGEDDEEEEEEDDDDDDDDDDDEDSSSSE